jgi:hypothetical protein
MACPSDHDVTVTTKKRAKYIPLSANALRGRKYWILFQGERTVLKINANFA